MGFSLIERSVKSWTSITQVRAALIRIPPNDIACRLTLPPDVVKELGWKANIRLDVLVGEGDDTGWFALQPATEDAKHRAKFKIQPNGVGRYTSKVLVPDTVTEPHKTWSPEAKIEDGIFYIKI